MKFKLSFITILLLSILSGCATSSNTQSSSVAKVVIAEPLPVNQQSEVAIARLTEILNRVEVSQEQKAKLFYDRGVIYDSVGLRGLASYDFQRALRLQPDLVDAYNFIGIHHTQRQEFLQAYEAFDSAIELDEQHQYAYLNRGIALYYGGRPQLALQDMRRFQLEQQNDPYRISWLYIIENEIDPVTAKNNLRLNLNSIDHNSWANNILRLFLGDISEQDFVASLTVGVKNHKELVDRLCEGYFYLGKYKLLNNSINTSSDYFKLALSTNVYEFIEHRYAKLELDLIQANVAPIPN
ncbi:lipoprotein NlpI [Thalassotalea psychrophila]|uniref:Lipoprotein NlpI n=1 Tax=Thalassotalea psychrophila TaxID=3065647 RepID=A0ABY9TPY2_9GAMM|nr:lipoprotein NlpI [Colwelliaceae bacterium SQ149]